MEGITNGSFNAKALQRQGYTRVTYGADDELLVRFEQKAVENKAESEKQGRPVFRTEDFIEIHSPGGKEVVIRKATEKDKQRFPIHWQNYLNGKGADIVGTPLEQWPMLGVDRVAELKALKFYTVEQIAVANDVSKQRMGMGANELQNQARAFLEAAAGNAPIAGLVAENEALKNELELLKQQVKEIAELQSKKVKAKSE